MNDTDANLERRGLPLLVVLTLLVFATSAFGAFVWDDLSLIVDNRAIREPDTLASLLSSPFWSDRSTSGFEMAPLYAMLHRPLVKLAYHFLFRLGDGSPVPFHLLSIVLHTANVLLVYEFLRDRLGPRTQVVARAALVGAALFAVHPSRAENVAWVSGLTDVAMTFFVLLSVRFFRRGDGFAHRIAGAASLAAAGFCKETAVLVPLLVLVDASLDGQPIRRALARTATAGAGALTVAVAWAFAVGGGPTAHLTNAGPAVPRVLATLGTFVTRIVAPWPPTIFPGILVRGEDGRPQFETASIAIGALLVVALAASFVVHRVAARRGRAPSLHAWSDVAWFVVPLLPVSNLVARSSQALAADRFLYLPSIGLVALLGRALLSSLAATGARRTAAMASIGAAVLASALGTMRSNERFEDNVALFQHETSIHPVVGAARLSYVNALRQANRAHEAASVALEGVRLARAANDETMEIRYVVAYLVASVEATPELDLERHRALTTALDGIVRERRLAFADERMRYTRTLPAGLGEELDRESEEFALGRALSHVKAGDLEGGERLLVALVGRAPGLATAWELLVLVRARLGAFEGAHRALAHGRAQLGDDDRLRRAAARVDEVERIARRPMPTPTMAAVRDANLQLMLGGPGDARRRLHAVLAANPTFVPAIVLLAHAESADGLPERARAVLDAGLLRRPGHPALLEARAALDAERHSGPTH